MSALYTNMIGRAGNQLFAYAMARSRAEREGLPLHTPPWFGEQVFAGVPVAERPNYSLDTEVPGYGQRQEDLTYTRAQVREWFKWKPEVEEVLRRVCGEPLDVAVHWRRGDYEGYGYPVISMSSIDRAVRRFAQGSLFRTPAKLISEEDPLLAPEFTHLPWLPDFYRLQQAKVLFRANSSFSWWAATLGHGRVFSPLIDGLGPGEHDVEFVEGNHPRLANLEFTTDLHLKES